MGRPRTSDADKVLNGTARPDRENHAPEPSEERPDPPAYLTDEEARIFDLFVGQLEELGIASATHTATIALAAQRQAQVVELGKVIDDEGAVYRTLSTTGAPVIKSNPAVAMRSQAMRHLHALLAELGLTPSSLSRVGKRGKKTATNNPFTELLGKPK